MQCLERSQFNYDDDILYVLGDIVDGWTETDKVIAELLKIKNNRLIVGNHDLWFLNWALRNDAPLIWTQQGGVGTMCAYGNESINVPQSHKQYIMSAHAYIEVETDDKQLLFIHGGYDHTASIESQSIDTIIWDRQLLDDAVTAHNEGKDVRFGIYDEIYVGHTSIYGSLGLTRPTKFCNVWAMDTGGGMEGVLSIMDIDTKEVWQSDMCRELYADYVKERGY
jgi:serine/threonine protein phosphatase 1